jgi:hypothetical protein
MLYRVFQDYCYIRTTKNLIAWQNDQNQPKGDTFKLTEGQYKSLSNYCKARKTTPIKLIKSNIGRFITAYTYDVPPNFYVTENQLELFHEE